MGSETVSLLKALGERAPRYTSYPAAPHFTSIQPEQESIWQAPLNLSQNTEGTAVSIYIHVPFCEQLCWFCGCNTSITKRYEPIDRFMKTLLKEIEHFALRQGPESAPALKVAHVHFGGGSPSVLREIDFSSIMAALRAHFDIVADAEIAVEIDPRTLTRGKILSMAREGVNRVSLGVQDFNPLVQSAVNRIQSFDMVKRAATDLRTAGIEALNLDLMYGLPLQTPESVARTAAQALELSPDRIALFPYAHVPWMKKHQALLEKHPLPGPQERLEMETVMSRIFRKAGLQAVGMDHYARPEDSLVKARDGHYLKRNFQGYSADPSDIMIGFGPSAISRLDIGFAQNTPDAKTWHDKVNNGRSAWIRGYKFNQDDPMFGEVIGDLLCYFQADLGAIADKYGADISIFAPARAAMQELIAHGLAWERGSIIYVNPDLPMALRPVAACFDQHMSREDEAPKYSKVV